MAAFDSPNTPKLLLLEFPAIMFPLKLLAAPSCGIVAALMFRVTLPLVPPPVRPVPAVTPVIVPPPAAAVVWVVPSET